MWFVVMQFVKGRLISCTTLLQCLALRAEQKQETCSAHKKVFCGLLAGMCTQPPACRSAGDNAPLMDLRYFANVLWTPDEQSLTLVAIQIKLQDKKEPMSATKVFNNYDKLEDIVDRWVLGRL